MKRIVLVMLAVAFLLSADIIIFARGAPKQKTYAADTVAVAEVSPIVAVESVPPLTNGYDVICNRSETLTSTLSPGRAVTTFNQTDRLVGPTSLERAQPELVLLN